jgi:hypothetical protein
LSPISLSGDIQPSLIFCTSLVTRMIQGLETCLKVNMLIWREKEEDVRGTNHGNMNRKEVERQGNRLC